MPPSPHFEAPVVVALFPSFAMLCWAHPRSATNKTFEEHTTWEYRVEYSCACKVRHQPYAMTTTDTFALLATPHIKETYYVRVVARATFAGSTAALVSAKLSFTATSNMSNPWSAVNPSPCIFDGLYLCAANACTDVTSLSSSRRVPHAHGCCIDKTRSVCVLDGDAEFMLYRAVYDAAVAPMHKRTVFYMSATGRASRSAQQRTRSRDVALLLQREDAAMVLCGVGVTGCHAMKAAHALLSSLMTASPGLCSHIYCVTYGSPRLFLKDGSQLVAHTLPLSYHFLHVTQLPLGDDLRGDEENGKVVAACPTGYDGGFYSNTLLGVQCSVAPSITGESALRVCVSSPQLPLTVDEVTEQYNAEAQLALLAAIFFPLSPPWMAPSVHSLALRTAGPLLHIVMEGVNLHYTPRLTVLPCQRTPLFPRVVECCPEQLICVASLLPWLETAAQQSASAVNQKDNVDLSLRALVQTSFGTAITADATNFTLPADLIELWRTTAYPAVRWADAAPPELLESALQTQPLHALCHSASTADPSLSAVKEILCAIASAAETALSEKARPPAAANAKNAGSVLAFMSDVASLFTTSGGGANSGGAPKLVVPDKEAAFLRNAIREWVASTSAGMEVWRLRSASWKQRVLHGLYSLNDKSYRTTLTRMLLLFDPSAELDAQAPHLWLEARLYIHTRLLVSQRQSSAQDVDDLLSRAVTLSDFYGVVGPIFAGDSAAASGVVSLPCVYEVALLWAICHCFELRRELSRTLFCCVAGCAGCGGATLAASVTSLVQTGTATAYAGSGVRRRVPICRLPAARVAALVLALQSSARVAVFLAGEAGDVVRPQYASLHMQIQESLMTEVQQLFRVLTKADEQLRAVAEVKDIPRDDGHFATHALAAVKTAVLGGGTAEERHVVALALAPSPNLLAQVLVCTHEEGAALASTLRAASLTTVMTCLQSSAEHVQAEVTL